MLSLLKHFNKGNFAQGLRFFAAQPAFSVALRSSLMLAANSRTVAGIDGVNREQTMLVQHSEATTMVPTAGDTRKARNLANQVACKALHFYKIIWQFLWLLKPADIFTGQNPFIVDAHYFLRQIVDTLTYLPHVESLEDELDNPSIRRSVIKSMEILELFSAEKEFQETYFNGAAR